MNDYPRSIAGVNQIEPVPRRIRAVLSGEVVLDTTAARYVWEWPPYPQYYVPLSDLMPSALVDEEQEQEADRGTAKLYGLRVGDTFRPGAVQVYTEDAIDGLAGLAHIDWDAVDAWFEEDEQVFVHPRNPYSRVDALRSTRHVRVEVEGCVVAESSSPVLVFETGLPTRYYLNRSEVDFTHLSPTNTVTACPYKGVTSGYWSAEIDGTTHADIAWTYDFPTAQLLPIAGLVAFYNEKVDITLDDRRLKRPVTHFS